VGLPARALLAAAEHRQDDVTHFLTDADAHQPLVRRRAAAARSMISWNGR
jgi:hypothetical protein